MFEPCPCPFAWRGQHKRLMDSVLRYLIGISMMPDCQPSEVLVLQPVINFLGHCILSPGTILLPSRVQQYILEWLCLVSVMALQNILWKVNFYNCFLPCAAPPEVSLLTFSVFYWRADSCHVQVTTMIWLPTVPPRGHLWVYDRCSACGWKVPVPNWLSLVVLCSVYLVMDFQAMAADHLGDLDILTLRFGNMDPELEDSVV